MARQHGSAHGLLRFRPVFEFVMKRDDYGGFERRTVAGNMPAEKIDLGLSLGQLSRAKPCLHLVFVQ
jgi:hypothetical protein